MLNCIFDNAEKILNAGRKASFIHIRLNWARLRSLSDLNFRREMLFHVKRYFNSAREGYGIMQRVQRQAQSSFVQSMLGLSKILKRRARQNVFSQPARKPWMQIHQRTVR
jgi:hypothetical protein